MHCVLSSMYIDINASLTHVTRFLHCCYNLDLKTALLSLGLLMKVLGLCLTFPRQRRQKLDRTKKLMFSPKCRSVEVINNSARPRSNHREVNYINNNNNNNNKLKRALRCDIDIRIIQG